MKVSHKTFTDKVPQVKEALDLSFSNTRSMLKQVDMIPERCGQWYFKRLSFKDRPNEHFVIHHRNPIEVIKGLWGDPAFSKDLVHKPAKLFRGSVQTEAERIFLEMWTAGFWNAAQVFTSFSTSFMNPICHTGINSYRRDNCSSYHCLQQDSIDPIFRQ